MINCNDGYVGMNSDCNDGYVGMNSETSLKMMKQLKFISAIVTVVNILYFNINIDIFNSNTN